MFIWFDRILKIYPLKPDNKQTVLFWGFKNATRKFGAKFFWICAIQESFCITTTQLRTRLLLSFIYPLGLIHILEDKKKLKSKRFVDIEDVKCNVAKVLIDIEENEFKRCFQPRNEYL